MNSATAAPKTLHANAELKPLPAVGWSDWLDDIEVGAVFVWNPTNREFRSLIRVREIIDYGGLPIICEHLAGATSFYSVFGLDEPTIRKMCVRVV